jgi:hypothetical protein
VPMPPLPRVLCRGHKGWTGVVYKCHAPVMQPGESGGRVVLDAQCKLCREAEVASNAEREQRNVRRTRRRCAGKEPWPEGITPANPFQGFLQEG